MLCNVVFVVLLFCLEPGRSSQLQLRHVVYCHCLDVESCPHRHMTGSKQAGYNSQLQYRGGLNYQSPHRICTESAWGMYLSPTSSLITMAELPLCMLASSPTDTTKTSDLRSIKTSATHLAYIASTFAPLGIAM